MKRWALALVLLLVAGCGPKGAPIPQPYVPPVAAVPAPSLISVDYNALAEEEQPGNGKVLVLPSMGHVHVAVANSPLVEWRVYPAAPGPDGAEQPLAVFFPQGTDGRLILDWEDPPATPVRLTLYAQVSPGAPDDPAYKREGNTRWAILTAALVRSDGKGGDRTGLLTQIPPHQDVLKDVITRFYAHMAHGEREQAWLLLDPSVQQPDPAAAKARFMQYAPQDLQEVGEYLGAQAWAGKKVPWCMCTLPVTEAFFRFQDGTLHSTYALPDDGSWRLVWGDFRGP